jgi:hypothetical protein
VTGEGETLVSKMLAKFFDSLSKETNKKIDFFVKKPQRKDFFVKNPQRVFVRNPFHFLMPDSDQHHIN